MNCQDAHTEMLVADRDELAGRASSPLAAHVAACADCRAAASSLTRGLDRLSAIVALRRVEDRQTRLVRRATIGVAAAAAILAIVVPGLRRASSRRADLPPLVASTNRVGVDVRPGQVTAVIATKDPKVTVVWIVQGGDH